MKSQLTCILFLFATACNGDQPAEPSPASPPIATRAPVETPTPAPASGFGEKPSIKKPGMGNEVSTPVAEAPHVIPDTLAECMKLGKDAVAKGDHEYAIELFEAAAKLDRKAMMPEIELARSYIASGKRALAIRHARRAVKRGPNSSLAFNTLGRAELARYSYDAAIVAFEKATELDANNAWAWNNLGLVYLTLEQYDDAANALVEATSSKSVTGYMWNNLGIAYEHLDRLDEARDAFENGGKLGSIAAKASRKRLDGVDSIAVVAHSDDQDFLTREPMPEDFGDTTDDTKPEEAKPEDAKPEDAKPEEAKPVETDTNKSDDQPAVAPTTTL